MRKKNYSITADGITANDGNTREKFINSQCAPHPQCDHSEWTEPTCAAVVFPLHGNTATGWALVCCTHNIKQCNYDKMHQLSHYQLHFEHLHLRSHQYCSGLSDTPVCLCGIALQTPEQIVYLLSPADRIQKPALVPESYDVVDATGIPGAACNCSSVCHLHQTQNLRFSLECWRSQET